MKQAKHMISKFPGTCDTCGRHIDAGESIYWKARGVVDCCDCAPPEQTASNTPAGDWAAALAWDDDTPEPGASIQASVTPKPRVRIEAGGEVVPLVVPSKGSPADRIAANRQPEPVAMAADPEPVAVTEETLATRLIKDQMILLVNAIGDLSPAECVELRAFLIDERNTTASNLRKRTFDKLAGVFG